MVVLNSKQSLLHTRRKPMYKNDLRKKQLSLLVLLACVGMLISNGCQGRGETKKGNPKTSEKLDTVGGISFQKLDSALSDASTGKFTQLTAAETGIEFQNDLLPANMRKYLLNGAGIATGDFDNDGLVDIYAISQDGDNRLFRQTDVWKFQDVTDSAGDLAGGNLQGTGAAFADVNNDGWLDLYACNINGENLLFINQQNGQFVEEAKIRGVHHPGATTMASFADYDQDGDLDLYLVNNRVLSLVEESPNLKIRKVGDRSTVHPDYLDQYFFIGERLQEAGQRDRLYRNDGQGNFEDVTDNAGIAGQDMGLSATWWDFDNDGWMDLYVANDLKSPDHLYRNMGDGTFKDVIADTVGHTPWFSMGADSADINNDGLMDFLVSDMSSTTHYKQKTTMGEMGNSAWFLTIGRPRQVMRNSLFVNSGSSRMFEAANLCGLDSTDWSWSIKFGDFDSDSQIDVFVTNGIGKNMNDSDAGQAYKQMMEEKKFDEARNQLLKMPPLKEENLIFRNKSNLEFENLSEEWGINHLGVSQGASVVDIDRDGDLDLLVNNMNEPLGIYRNDIANSNNLLVQLRGSSSNHFGLNARITIALTDGKRLTRFINSARGFMSADEPVAHFGLGTATKVDKLTVEWPGGWTQEFTDIEANQIVTVSQGTTGQVQTTSTKDKSTTASPLMKDTAASGLVFKHRESPYDDFQQQPLLPNKLSQLGPGIAWGDVNNDGLADCYMGNGGGFVPALFIQNEDQTFSIGKKFSESRPNEDMGALFFDIDADDDLDLYVASGGYEREIDSEYLRDRLYLNDGQGNFELAPSDLLPDSLQSSSSVSAVDFDRDGDLDLFVGTRLTPRQWPMPATSRLLENRDGKLVDATATIAPQLENVGLVTGSIWSDVDQDGWTDLLLSVEWGPVKLFRNESGKLVDATESAGLSAQVGWWNSISGGDIDNDGDIDFVAMNFGLNTKYHGDDKHPVVLFANDFDENGTLDLVEAEYENDVCYPVRGRSCSSHAMPFLKEKFPTYHEFALADINDIYSDESLEKSTRFSANQLQSMVMINDGKGNFTHTALPRIAQVAPGFGTVLQDMNGDGNIDLCIAQNFLQPQPETGQMDGGMGMVLSGNGDGTFRLMPPNKSGIAVEGQGMALGVVDLNNDAKPDLVMTLNDTESKVWTNQLGSDRQFWKLDLQYVAGNRSAVGSRVVARYASGKTRTHQVVAGSGYLSQSTTSIFLSNHINDPIEELEINWPDGTSQTEKVESGSNLVVEQKAIAQAAK